MPETKICEACGQEIGSSETICPKCKTDLNELEEQVQAVERAQKVIDARKAKAATQAAPAAPATPDAPAPKRSIFRNLAKG